MNESVCQRVRFFEACPPFYGLSIFGIMQWVTIAICFLLFLQWYSHVATICTLIRYFLFKLFSRGVTGLYSILINYGNITYHNTLPSKTYLYIFTWQTTKQSPDAVELTTGVEQNRGPEIYPRGWFARKNSSQIYFEKSLSSKNESISALPLFMHCENSIASTCTMPNIITYLNTILNTLGFDPEQKSCRQPIGIQHKKPLNFVGQSESSLTSPINTRELAARFEDPSRLTVSLGSLEPTSIHRVFQSRIFSSHILLI